MAGSSCPPAAATPRVTPSSADRGDLALEVVRGELPDLPGADDAVGVDEVALRWRDDLVGLRERPVRVGDARPVRTLAHCERLGRGRRVLEHDADDTEARMASLRLLEERE